MNDDRSFDERAATWDDDPSHVARASMVADRIAETVPLDRSLRLLEYGAGTGLVTQALRDRVGSVTLADASSGMRTVIQAKVDRGALAGATVASFDLAHGPVPEVRFDLIVTVLVLHHVDDLDRVLSGFAEMLAPGGRLCIVDLDEEDGSFHGEGFAGHHGFDHVALERSILSAGFSDVHFERCGHLERDGVEYPMFLAVARGGESTT